MRSIVGAAVVSGVIAAALPVSVAHAAAARVSYERGQIIDVSSSCSGQNAEVEQAIDARNHDVYELWMGCHGIGFARSTDAGQHFDAPIHAPGASLNTWDPALTVAADGTLYIAFMTSAHGSTYPVVDASFDHGATFVQSVSLVPPVKKNWGDRDFIATAPDGTVYVTWDYGPSAAAVKFICSPNGSCAFSAGDLNVVMQRSVDHGRTWGPIVPISPGFPASGADSAPLLVEPDGRIDVEYQGYTVTNPKTYSLAPAHSYFTSSTDGGQHWSAPVRIGPSDVTMSKAEWWIDGDISRSSDGTLFVTWDSQHPGGDVGWLSYSTDSGAHWSPLIRATPDVDNATHIVQPVGGSGDVAYVAWLADKSGGYALYLRAFSVSRGWLSAPYRVSLQLGSRSVWPGDTIGISRQASLGGPGAARDAVVLSWGSAVPGLHGDSEIFAARVDVDGSLR